MQLLGIAIAITSLIGVGLLLVAAVLALGAVGDNRADRWLDRHPVVPCATLRPGTNLPAALAVYGRTAPGRDGLVVAPISGDTGVWFHAEVTTRTSSGETTDTRIIWERSAGDPFRVVDASGSIEVSARMLPPSSAFSGYPGLSYRAVDEATRNWRRPGPRLQQLIDAGLVNQSQLKGAESVTVQEDVLKSEIPAHLIGQPRLVGGAVQLAPPRFGRRLAMPRSPEETRRALIDGHREGLQTAKWAALIGVAFMAILAIEIAFVLPR